MSDVRRKVNTGESLYLIGPPPPSGVRYSRPTLMLHIYGALPGLTEAAMWSYLALTSDSEF